MGYEILVCLLVAAAIIIVLLVVLFKARAKLSHYESRYGQVIDADREAEQVRKASIDEAAKLKKSSEQEAAALKKASEQEAAEIKRVGELEVEKLKKEQATLGSQIADIQSSYKEKIIIFDQLVRKAAIYDEEIELAEFGFYKPHFDFDTSEKFKEQIDEVRSRQKKMISNRVAVFCKIEWTVEGSKAKGKTMTNRNISLTARAFNNECDAAIANVRWNNVSRMEARINKSYEAINKLNESNQIIIAWEYLELKLKELRLTHEYQEKKQREKEEQAEIRRQMKEEAKLQQEVEASAREEEKYQKLLQKARTEAEKATGAKLEKLQAQIAELDAELAEAHSKSERAKSMAEQTRRGHVYVISNIGSFGENVYKIGMTRRLEPLDRVRELGDASVPFLFDVHAMIFSEDAPALENALHQEFDSTRLNLVNTRKEFFNVTLDEIKNRAQEIAADAEFIETIEAREYRESEAIRAQREASADSSSANKFPVAI